MLAGFSLPGRFDRQGVVIAVTGKHGLGRRFESLGLSGKVGTGATLLLAGVAWELDAINREHRPSDQALSVTEVENLGEEPGDILAQTRDKGSDGRKVGRAVTGECNERHVLSAQPFNPTAADHAFGVGAEDDLKQPPGG